MTHTVQAVYSLEADKLMEYSLQRRIFTISMFTMGRLGVPIFFFLTGYLLLDREYPREKYIAFLKRNVGGLYLTTAIWIVIYNIFNALFYGTAFGVGKCLKNLVFIKSTDMGHMWYMPAILGMYLFLPFVANALKHTDEKVLCIPLAIACIYRFAVPVINIWLTAGGQETISSLPDVSFSGNEYGIMILLGYLVKKNVFDKIPSAVFIVIGTVGFIFTVVTQNYSDMQGITYTVWYDSGSLLIAALSIFVLLSRISLKYEKVATSISRASFGIFLLHNLVLIPLTRYYQPGMSSVSRLAVLFMVTFVLSWLIAALLGRNKMVSRILMFQK